MILNNLYAYKIIIKWVQGSWSVNWYFDQWQRWTVRFIISYYIIIQYILNTFYSIQLIKEEGYKLKAHTHKHKHIVWVIIPRICSLLL